jgi:hypothetical protein
MNMTNNAGTGSLTSVSTEYSTASPWNSDNSRLILQHQSYFGLYDGNGAYLRDLPFAVNASSEPRWSRRDANVLYFVSGKSLMKLDVAAGAASVVRAFGEYAAISGRGESDISPDGDHFVFAGDARYVFVYAIDTDAKGPVLDAAGHAFDSLYIASDNSVVIGWIPTGTGRFTGVELFDRNMAFERQLTHALGHMRLTRDTNGDDLLIWTSSDDPTPLAHCANGIVRVRLASALQTCLLPLDWSLAVHITAPDGNGWAFVETYAPSDPFFASAAWTPYTNEILQVKLDGTETRRLLHHRSRPLNRYAYQPRATVSRDGSRLAFTSNYDLPRRLGYPAEYTDAYLAMVPETTSSSQAMARAGTPSAGRSFAAFTRNTICRLSSAFRAQVSWRISSLLLLRSSGLSSRSASSHAATNSAGPSTRRHDVEKLAASGMPVATTGSPALRYSRSLIGLMQRVSSFTTNGHTATSKPLA